MKITIQELSKSFGGRDIFSNFSLEVDSGVRLCVCGPNGTGKSTFLRLLAGVDSADGGRVILPRGCRMGYVEQELSEEALNTPLLTYVLDVLHDWSDFWTQWEEAAADKAVARHVQPGIGPGAFRLEEERLAFGESLEAVWRGLPEVRLADRAMVAQERRPPTVGDSDDDPHGQMLTEPDVC